MRSRASATEVMPCRRKSAESSRCTGVGELSAAGRRGAVTSAVPRVSGRVGQGRGKPATAMAWAGHRQMPTSILRHMVERRRNFMPKMDDKKCKMYSPLALLGASERRSLRPELRQVFWLIPVRSAFPLALESGGQWPM